MSLSKRSFFLVSFNLLFITIFAQDKIYLKNYILEGKIIEVSSGVIKYYSNYNSHQVLLLPSDQVFILFNGKGDYLIPSKLNTSSTSTKKLLDRFFSADSAHCQKDQLFTRQNKRMEADIIREDNNSIFLQDPSQIDKKNILAVIYKKGGQRIYGAVDSAASVLWAMQEEVIQADRQPATPPENKATVEQKNNVATNEKKNATTNEKSLKGDTNSSNDMTKADSARQKAFSEIAGNISRKDFEDRAVQKTNKLNEYLKILCNKSATYEKSNEAIDQAVSLFVNENAIVETSSIKKNTVNHYKIREYLTRVKLFKYDRIEIEWTHVQYVSDLKLGADGNFYGVVTFEQEFRGYRDNQLVYSDITRKNTNVILKTYNKNYEGTTKTIWDVLLSDIGVVYTKSSDIN
jgi:hypothetical protein